MAGMGVNGFRQAGFRLRNDDGDEITATWGALLNVDWSQDSDETFRVRFLVEKADGTSPFGTNVALFYSLNGGTYIQTYVDGQPLRAVRPFLSDHVVEDEATTQQLGSGDFYGGSVNETDCSSAVFSAVNGKEYEFEFVVQIRGVDVDDGDEIQLELRQGVSLFSNGYTETPLITVVKNLGLVTGDVSAKPILTADVSAHSYTLRGEVRANPVVEGRVSAKPVLTGEVRAYPVLTGTPKIRGL